MLQRHFIWLTGSISDQRRISKLLIREKIRRRRLICPEMLSGIGTV